MSRRVRARLPAFALAALLAGSTAAFAEERGHATPDATEIRMLIYNVAFVPWIVDLFLGNQGSCRGERVGQILPALGLDLVVLNETMSSGPTEAVARHYPHKVINQPNSSFLRPIPGGVSILSRYPLAPDWHAEVFEEFHGINGLLTQGFVHALAEVADGLRINVIATHLDTFDEPRDRAARRSQLAQIARFLEQKESVRTWPTFLLGDMNIDGMDPNAPEYRSMLDRLTLRFGAAVRDAYVVANGADWLSDPNEAERANTDVCFLRLAPCTFGGQARIDYILYWDHPDFDITPLTSTTHAFPDEQRCDVDYLSDHKAVEASFRIRRK